MNRRFPLADQFVDKDRTPVIVVSMRCFILTRAALLAVLMLLTSWSAMVPELGETKVQTALGRASGIDVYPSGFDIEYTSSSDESKYRLLSSHDPSLPGVEL